MLTAFRSAITRRLELAVEIAAVALSLSGATLAAVLGKLLIAVILGAITLGFFLRLTSRRAGRVALPAPTPLWLRLLAALLSVFEVAALVEAINLPVRFHDPGFAYLHWALTVIALFVAYVLQVRLLRGIRSRARAVELR